eukprot:2938972-Pyramimonas_sp.AAC.1
MGHLAGSFVAICCYKVGVALALKVWYDLRLRELILKQLLPPMPRLKQTLKAKSCTLLSTLEKRGRKCATCTTRAESLFALASAQGPIRHRKY